MIQTLSLNDKLDILLELDYIIDLEDKERLQKFNEETYRKYGFRPVNIPTDCDDFRLSYTEEFNEMFWNLRKELTDLFMQRFPNAERTSNSNVEIEGFNVDILASLIKITGHGSAKFLSDIIDQIINIIDNSKYDLEVMLGSTMFIKIRKKGVDYAEAF